MKYLSPYEIPSQREAFLYICYTFYMSCGQRRSLSLQSVSGLSPCMVKLSTKEELCMRLVKRWGQWLSPDVMQQHLWVLGIVHVQWWYLSQNRGFASESLLGESNARKVPCTICIGKLYLRPHAPHPHPHPHAPHPHVPHPHPYAPPPHMSPTPTPTHPIPMSPIPIPILPPRVCARIAVQSYVRIARVSDLDNALALRGTW